MAREFIIKVLYGGLGDHLFLSHLPRIAKQYGGYDHVYISTLSDIRNRAYAELIWRRNPYVDGYKEADAPYPEFDHVDPDMNLLDRMMLERGLDDGLRFHEPEIYYKPARLEEFADKAVYDPNFVSGVGDVSIDEIESFIALECNLNCQLKPRERSFHIQSLALEVVTQSLLNYCDIIHSCARFYCLTSGGATLAAALGKPVTAFYGRSQKTMFHHSHLHRYIDVSPEAGWVQAEAKKRSCKIRHSHEIENISSKRTTSIDRTSVASHTAPRAVRVAVHCTWRPKAVFHYRELGLELVCNPNDWAGYDFALDMDAPFSSVLSAYPPEKRMFATTEPSRFVQYTDELLERFTAYYGRLILSWHAPLRKLPQCRPWHAVEKWATEISRDEQKHFGLGGLISDKHSSLEGYALRHQIIKKQNEFLLPGVVYNYKRLWRGKSIPYPVPSKDPALKYMFHLAIENCIEEGYFTEKIIDAFATRSVPLYFGDPKIGESFDDRGIIILDPTHFVTQINALTEADYMSRLPYIHDNFERSKEYWNLDDNLAREISRELLVHDAATVSLHVSNEADLVCSGVKKESTNPRTAEKSARLTTNERAPLLTLLCYGRNEAYLGNFMYRMATSLNRHAANIKSLGLSNQIEILVSDWGSARPLYKDLGLSDQARALVRFVITPQEVARGFDKDGGFSIPHAINVVARRANGTYLMLVDPDLYLTRDSFQRLWRGVKNGKFCNQPLEDSFFCASRRHIPKSFVDENPRLEEIEQHISEYGNSYVWDRLEKERFRGTAIAWLLSRHAWCQATGWDERLIHWGWSDIDWHMRLSMKYRYNDFEAESISMYHLEHYENRANYTHELKRKHNDTTEPTAFAPNPSNWGLGDIPLIIVNGRGDSVSSNWIQSTETSNTPSIDPSCETSPLENIINPEIKNDSLYDVLFQLAQRDDVQTVLEIGSSSGQGSTEAFVKGILKHPGRKKLFCLEVSKPRFSLLTDAYRKHSFVEFHNASSVPVDSFLSESDVAAFYQSTPTKLNMYAFDRVLGWLRDDKSYLRTTGVAQDGIENIRRKSAITHFDLVLIDGSAFTGSAELRLVYGARFIVLDDIDDIKNYRNYHELANDQNYKLLTEDRNLRNGYAIFERIADVAIPVQGGVNLPINFFTIVMNGEPFIRYHIDVFKHLPFKWRWHIVEGVADLTGDTAWSLANGGRIADAVHRNGRSRDGTTEYLAALVRTYPENVIVYSKSDGKFWNGKVEMVNAPLANIGQECLLWQIDVDEFWSAEQIQEVRRMFMGDASKTSAHYRCHYFVGADLVVSTRNSDGSLGGVWPQDDKWPRTWRFRPGMSWLTHEPPNLGERLPNGQWRNLSETNPFSQKDTERNGLVFQHFSYCNRDQIKFKEIYYGYSDACTHWDRLQAVNQFPVRLNDFFPWVANCPSHGEGFVEKAERLGIRPLFAQSSTEDVSCQSSVLVDEVRPNDGPRSAGHKIKIAGDDCRGEDLTQVASESEFARAIDSIFRMLAPQTIIETGTYHGVGTTLIIARALRKNGIIASFKSIECNSEHVQIARANLDQIGLASYVDIVNGLSIPRSKLPSAPEIERDFSRASFEEQVYIDYRNENRAELYYRETNFPEVADDLLGQCLKQCNYRPDFVLLDSAGHIGFAEFEYLLGLLQGQCVIALDDVYHVKHYRSLQIIKSDPRFKILALSREKFGFCIAEFNPIAMCQSENVKRVIWIRPDAIGDNILASSTLPYIRKHYSSAKLAVVCDRRVAELYKNCPCMDDIVEFDRDKIISDQAEFEAVAVRLKEFQADVCLNSVLSSEPLTDALVARCAAPETVGYRANIDNSIPEMIEKHNQIHSRTLLPYPLHDSELERHRKFINRMGIDAPSLRPVIWFSQDDEDFADALFKSHDLDPARTIAFFAGAQSAKKAYYSYGKALRDLCREQALSVVAFGAEADFALNQQNLDDLECRSVNLSGKTTLLQCGALLKRCRMAVGADTGLAHVACAVNTPLVVLLGGGHFGRFFPYSLQTSVVALPLDCYGCGWHCKFSKIHCVADVPTTVLKEAIRATFDHQSEKPRVFVPSRSAWSHRPGLPEWQWPHPLLAASCVEIVEVASDSPKPTTLLISERESQESAQKPISVNDEHSSKIEVSICIITNSGLTQQVARQAYLERLLSSIGEAKFPMNATEIIICGAVGKPYPKTRVIDRSAWAASGQVCGMRNATLQVARGDIIIHCDDDVLFTPGYWAAVKDALHGNWDILCTRLLNPNGTRYWDWAAYYPQKGQTLLPYDATDSFVYATGGHAIYRKSVFQKLRWNDAITHGRNEEFDIASQARQYGLKFAFCPHATVFLQYHHCDAQAVITRTPQAPDRPCSEFVAAMSLADKSYTPVKSVAVGDALVKRIGHKLLPSSERSPEPTTSDAPIVSILVCCNRYLQRFRLFAQSICRQNFDLHRCEIVVANPHSPDGLSNYLAGLTRASDVMKKGKRAGPHFKEVLADEKFYRNRGLLIQSAFERSRGRIVVGMDADLILPPNFLTKITSVLENNPNRVVGVYRNFLSRSTTDSIIAGLLDPISEFDQLLTEDETEPQGYRGILGYCQAVKREKWQSVGYPTEFDNIAKSDVAFVEKLAGIGVTPLFLQDLKVLHLHHERDWNGTQEFL